MLQPISTTVSRNHSKHMKTERLKHNGGSVPEAKELLYMCTQNNG